MLCRSMYHENLRQLQIETIIVSYFDYINQYNLILKFVNIPGNRLDFSCFQGIHLMYNVVLISNPLNQGKRCYEDHFARNFTVMYVIYLPYFSTKGLPPYMPTAQATQLPTTQPMAPAKPASKSENVFFVTKYPAKGIIISEGRGMHALSIPINKTIPPNPKANSTEITHPPKLSQKC